MTSSHRASLWTLILVVVFGAVLAAPAYAQIYATGGALLDWGDDTRFRDADCASQMPAALYGCGTGNDGAPLSSRGGFGTIAGLEFGVGYAIKPFLRLEAGIQYRPGFTFEGDANFTQLSPGDRHDVTAELSVLSGMTAAYLDIGELLLFHYAPIGPFIGVGGGLSHIEISDTRMDFPVTSTIVPGGRYLSFSWMLTAGLSISLSPRLMLDAGWRYTDHGRIETARGEGRVVRREDGQVLAAFDLIETRGHLRSHGLSVSLRYAF